LFNQLVVKLIYCIFS